MEAPSPLGVDKLIIFGIRSPMVVEYEETCRRLGITIQAAVSVGGTPRYLGPGPVLEIGEIAGSHLVGQFVACAFAPTRRRELADMALSCGLYPAPTLVDPNAHVAATTRLGDGGYINGGAIVGAATILGDRVVVNRQASVGHHCIVGNDVSIGPGVTIAGNSRIGNGVLIGAGAIILPNVRIAAGTVVSGGSVVRKSEDAPRLLAGNPARSYRLSAQPHTQEDDQE